MVETDELPLSSVPFAILPLALASPSRMASLSALGHRHGSRESISFDDLQLAVETESATYPELYDGVLMIMKAMYVILR